MGDPGAFPQKRKYLDFQKAFGYKEPMELTEEIKISLKREYTLCSNAMAFYEKAIKDFEQKYHSPTDTFLKQFESGKMGDDADFFDWYAFTKLLEQWEKTQSVLRSVLQ